jgi:hypothetical protein
MTALARRIVQRATPMLDARRRGHSSWWEYAAAWAGTLLPLGAAAALVASVSLLWSATSQTPVRAHAMERTALLRVITNQAPSRDLVDFLLDAPAAEQGRPSSRGGSR